MISRDLREGARIRRTGAGWYGVIVFRLSANGRDHRHSPVALWPRVQGCGANHGEVPPPVNLKVTNNTTRTVIARACYGLYPSCRATAYTIQLQPGQSGTTAQQPDGIFRPMMVTSEYGAVLGCLPFQFNAVTPTNADVKITEMVPCGDTLGKAHSGGHDWPYGNY